MACERESAHAQGQEEPWEDEGEPWFNQRLFSGQAIGHSGRSSAVRRRTHLATSMARSRQAT
eukprot:8073289-Pyramimonas_sp.AAC.1